MDEVTSKSRFIHRNATFVDGNCSLAATKLGCYPKHCGGLSREWSSPFLVFLAQKDPSLFPKLLLQAVSDTKRPLSVPENGFRSQTGTIMASSVPESDFPINEAWRETHLRPQTHILYTHPSPPAAMTADAIFPHFQGFATPLRGLHIPPRLRRGDAKRKNKISAQASLALILFSLCGK